MDSSPTTTEPKYFIGLDIGTQSTKGILYDPITNKILKRESINYDLLPTKSQYRAEQDTNEWINACNQILLKLVTNNNNNEHEYMIGGIGISGQQHGMVILDESHNVIRPAKLWCDVEAHVEAKEFTQKATKIVNRPYHIPAGFTAPKVLWLKNNENKNFLKMKYCVLPHDYISFILRDGIGGFITDSGDASGTGVYDPVTKKYNRNLSEIVDDKYYDCLPKVIEEPHGIAGTLGPTYKKLLNINYDIPISIGSGDNMCSALGVGCVTPGMAVLSLGTSATIFGVSSSPVLPPKNNYVASFCDATGRYLPLTCIMSCTAILQSVLESSSPNNTSITHEEATNLASKIQPGCHDLILLPYLNGERTPNWPLSFGALLNINANNISLISTKSPGLLYRAALEGISMAIKLSLEEMEQTGFIISSSLLVVGGGSKNILWRHILSDVLNLTLQFPKELESAALGAAFQVGAAVDDIQDVEKYVLKQKIDLEDCVISPNMDNVDIYKKGYDKFKSFAKRLFD